MSADLERRIDAIERAVYQNTIEHKLIVEELHSVAEKTSQVASNTAEIVTIFKGASILRSLILFGAPFVTAILGMLAFAAWLIGAKQ